MKFGVLGPLSLMDGSDSLLPSAPKTRQLLALLLLNANSPVALDTCVQELWGADAPRSAVQSVHTRVFQIRQALAGPASGRTAEEVKQILETHHQGYSLRVEHGALDLHSLEQYLADFRQAQSRKDDLLASVTLRSALDLWRGHTLLDVQHGTHIQAIVTGLEYLHMTALEQCIDAELRLGMHHQLLSELSTLVSRHPVHENLHAQYMIALYRSGRTAQSLEAYHRLHEKLTDELGIAPSQRIRQLHMAVLTESTELDVTPPERMKLSLDLMASR
ncbi:AfsR/SARP family transcriptional regulator [Streptomyces inhibens]|uniref:AfsR/SARP family transcriptional regulator n=1 Tax=Streptomyces inhibens TaxID=2293571 RepID=UPI001EE75A39|nr:AfsR/SARP family transcriptional regulator [Streptomyces inhibens]UKY53524.1 AfsR/SARP family transcriptional regulator [Streptomyces inhibens]